MLTRYSGILYKTKNKLNLIPVHDICVLKNLMAEKAL